MIQSNTRLTGDIERFSISAPDTKYFYTKQEVDDKLDKKSSGAIFDITPFLDSEGCPTEAGFKLLVDFINKGFGTIIKYDSKFLYCTSVSENNEIVYAFYPVVNTNVSSSYFVGVVLITITVGNYKEQEFTVSPVSVNPTEEATETLSTIKINGVTYNIVSSLDINNYYTKDEVKAEITQAIGNIITADF